MVSPYEPTKSILIDFDGTVAPFSWPNPTPPPFAGSVEAIRTLYRAGFYIVIFSARFWSGWDRPELPEKHNVAHAKAEVTAYLEKYGIPYHELSAEKRPCLCIIDDSAFRAGPDFDWAELVKWVKAGGGKRNIMQADGRKA